MKMKHTSFLLLAALPALAQGPKAAPPSYVQVEAVSSGHDKVMRKSIGHADAVRTVNICAAVEGFLHEVNVQEGAPVKEGDVLMKIYPLRYEAALKQKEAAVKALEAQIIYAQNRYKRLRELSKQFAASQQDTETALTKLETLKAQKAGAEADVIKARKDLEDCTIRAEVTGRIGRLALSRGNYITKGEQLATITQIDPIYVRFPLSQSDVDSIFHGADNIDKLAKVNIRTADGLAYPATGKVSIVNNLLTGNTDTYTLWAEFENPDHKLTHRSGAAVYVTLAETAEVCMVPLTAVHHDARGSFVYTVDEAGKVARRNVTTGGIQGRMQSVYDGLQVGEIVITDGAHKTREGGTIIPVFPRNAAPAADSAQPQAEEAPLAVSAATVGEMSDPTIITCQGARVEAINKVELRPLVQGLLQHQDFREGDLVTKDEVLFRIDPTRYAAEVAACKSALAQLEVSIGDARTKYLRQQQLMERNASSKDDLESAKATLDELLAQKESAEAALAIAEDDLSRCTIRSGLEARIGRVNFSEGNYITDIKSPLATIVQLSPIYVRFPLSERTILSGYGNDERFIREAAITLITATGKELSETGQVSFCDNIIQIGTDTQNVWATFRNADHELTPGGVVTVRIARKPEYKVPCVPEAAVQIDTAGHYVYTVQDGHAVRTDIIIGSTAEDGQVAVHHGLQPGQQVIISRLAEVQDGSPVTIE